MDALKQLWNSTADFQKRFGLDERFNLFAQMRCVHEELAEFNKEVYGAFFADDPLTAENFSIDAAQEAADVIVTVLGVLMGMKMSYADIEDALERIAAKNDAKKPDTHAINENGKVARKQAVS